MPDKLEVEIFTDGACSGNPGAGGWAAVLTCQGQEKVMSGGEYETTNNRMEILGLLRPLQALKQPSKVYVHTDSSYLMDSVTKWIYGWMKNGWKTKAKKPVANQDLWQEMLAQMRRHELHFTKVKGHSGHELNERVDKLAVEACKKFGGKQK